MFYRKHLEGFFQELYDLTELIRLNWQDTVPWRPFFVQRLWNLQMFARQFARANRHHDSSTHFALGMLYLLPTQPMQMQQASDIRSMGTGDSATMEICHGRGLEIHFQLPAMFCTSERCNL